MKYLLTITFLICCVVSQPFVYSKSHSLTKPVSESKYKAGQKWSYITRSTEKASYFIVLKVDSDPKAGNIVHIALRGLKIKNPNSPDGFSSNVDHMPFSEESINKSAVKLLKENVELPDYEEGYKIWKEAFDAKRAGYYTITIAEAVKVMEGTLNQ